MSLRFRKADEEQRALYRLDNGALISPQHTMVDGKQAVYTLHDRLDLSIERPGKSPELWTGPVGLESYKIAVQLSSHTTTRELESLGLRKLPDPEEKDQKIEPSPEEKQSRFDKET